jgi:hypothetical protein
MSRTSLNDLLRRHNPTEQPPSIFPDILDDDERNNGQVSLIVSDVQRCFGSCTEALLQAVERQVKLAIQRHWWIIVLEYDSCNRGRTHERILKLLEGYDRWTWWDKGRVNGGGPQVEMSCFDFRFASNVFRVVGVNTDECNIDTITGVLRRFPRSLIRVIREACNTDSGRDDPWEKYPNVPNLAISSESIDFPADQAEPGKAGEPVAA